MTWVRKSLSHVIAILQLIKYNWKNIVILIKDGILYTSSRLIGTNVEDSDDEDEGGSPGMGGAHRMKIINIEKIIPTSSC